ncbi:hypothetical protein [Nocardia jinanensis]|uniref:Uncharacterized protein n=1 Tax=Nocardia jinanensis TaxID=382504 RepID=A0A917VQH3_9NOCA|nr:hypothetical protein [Nocardia jinanensis]GGL04101.1 hypothetical protein GCM10011588_18400 [Nocardia jinanensis]
MTARTTALLLPAAAALAVGTLVATAAPAAADGGSFQTVYSLTDGPCVAQVDTSVKGPGYPEHASFTVSTIMFGVGSCSLPVTLNWRNLDTGETGSTTRTANGPGYWMNDGRSSLFHPGIGRFTATVSVGAAHIPESGSVDFVVEKYQG